MVCMAENYVSGCCRGTLDELEGLHVESFICSGVQIFRYIDKLAKRVSVLNPA